MVDLESKFRLNVVAELLQRLVCGSTHGEGMKYNVSRVRR